MLLPVEVWLLLASIQTSPTEPDSILWDIKERKRASHRTKKEKRINKKKYRRDNEIHSCGKHTVGGYYTTLDRKGLLAPYKYTKNHDMGHLVVVRVIGCRRRVSVASAGRADDGPALGAGLTGWAVSSANL